MSTPTPASPSPSNQPPRRSPSRRELKQQLLWCARWLLGDGKFFEGKRFDVQVTAPDEGEKVVVKPVRGIDGMTTPGPLAGPTRVATEASQAELLGVLFSRDEIRILAEMLGGKAVKAGQVLEAVRLEKTKFYALWTNLQQRGVVGDPEDGEGFVVLLPWVLEYVRARVEGEGRPAA